MTSPAKPARQAFTRYQVFVIAILAFLQFTIILDFMIMAPLGAIVMPALHISPRQFGLAVSLYAVCLALNIVFTRAWATHIGPGTSVGPIKIAPPAAVTRSIAASTSSMNIFP